MVWTRFLKGIAIMSVMTGMLLAAAPVQTEAATNVNLGNERIFNSVYIKERQAAAQKTYPVINVGYIIVGDNQMLLDDLTMGYIRRVLNTKFPGNFYPSKRMESSNGAYQKGRRNYTDKYNLVEARDVLMKEIEFLEQKEYEKSENKDKPVSLQGANLSNSPVNIVNVNKDEEEAQDEDNSYSYTKYLSMLPKEKYVTFARMASSEGKSDYDYLVIFNIHMFDRQIKERLFANTMWSDFRISVKAIDVTAGEYIDRREYHKRGYSASTFGSPSWRKGMRQAIINGMIESFDNLPIGKYSVCDNPYCERRQREKQEESVLGKSRRHCVKHCHTMDNCDNHLVNYALDADLPSGYVNNEHERVD